MATTITLSQEFLSGFPQSVETTLHNIVDRSVVEMKKLAPYARPAQYPRGYRGTPGSLMRSIGKQGRGLDMQIISTVPYAVRRNYENKLNPQTLKYIQRSIENTLRGDTSRWWVSEE